MNIFIYIVSYIIIHFRKNKHHNCWKNSYGRGVGLPISTCPADLERNGLLCYPICKEGF